VCSAPDPDCAVLKPALFVAEVDRPPEPLVVGEGEEPGKGVRHVVERLTCRPVDEVVVFLAGLRVGPPLDARVQDPLQLHQLGIVAVALGERPDHLDVQAAGIDSDPSLKVAPVQPVALVVAGQLRAGEDLEQPAGILVQQVVQQAALIGLDQAFGRRSELRAGEDTHPTALWGEDNAVEVRPPEQLDAGLLLVSLKVVALAEFAHRRRLAQGADSTRAASVGAAQSSVRPHLPLLSLVVGAPGAGLMAAAPPGPGQHEPRRDRSGPHQRDQQAADLRDGQRQQAKPAAQAAVPPFARSRLVAWARVMARNACASSARVTCRYQPGHLRTS